MNLPGVESVIDRSHAEVQVTRASQKNEELFYVEEFLRDQLGFETSAVVAAQREPPDGVVTIRGADGATLLLDFEIAEYYVDESGGVQGGSPSKQVSGVWEQVLAALDPRLESLRLPGDLNLRFKEPVLLKKRHIDGFADELIRFAQEFCPEGHLDRTTHEAFSIESYPLLDELVERITLTCLEGTGVLPWHCSNIAAAHVGVVLTHLTDLIRRKSGRPFTWRPGTEKCLLIYASGATVTSRAGPPPPDPSIWDDSSLASACTESIFDRIYFWDRVRRWHQGLK